MTFLNTVDDVFDFIQPFILTNEKWDLLKKMLSPPLRGSATSQRLLIHQSSSSSVNSPIISIVSTTASPVDELAKKQAEIINTSFINVLFATQSRILGEEEIKGDLPQKIEREKGKGFIVRRPYTSPPVFHKPANFVKFPKDSLFWFIYIQIHGCEEFQYIKNRQTNVMVEEKQRMVEYLKSLNNSASVKQFMKKQKITGILMKELLSDLSLNVSDFDNLHLVRTFALDEDKHNGFFVKRDNFKMVLLYCFYYKITIYCIHPEKKIWFAFNEDNEEQTKCIVSFGGCETKEQTGEQIYRFISLADGDETTFQFVKDNYFKIENIQKPLMSISNYKMNELKTIAEKLEVDIYHNVEEETKMKKNELYERLCEYMTP
jgi:hypothetical protein